MEICVLLSEKEARAKVADLIGQPVARTTFFNWRKFLRLVQPHYSLGQVEAIALFGGYVKKGMSMSTALDACKCQQRGQ